MPRVEDVAFSPAFGNRPSRLVGREQLLDGIIAGLDTRPGSRERSTVLLGQRGSGKTVLLWELAERARNRGFVVANPTAVREGMVARVAEKLWDDGRDFAARQIKPTSGSVGALGFSLSLDFGEQVVALSAEGRLEQLVRELTKQRLGTLLLVDELQANSPDVRSLVNTYQELVGQNLDVAIVLAGLPAATSGVLNDHVLTFLNRANKLSLPPLDIAEVNAYYRRAFRECGLTVPADLRKRAAEATAGSPYLMQLIGHYVVMFAQDDGIVGKDDLDEALGVAQDTFESDVCGTTLAALSQRDIDYLRAMAELGGTCRSADVAEKLGVTPDYGQQYRRRLLDAGVIESPRSGIVHLAVPHLRSYLLRQD